MQFVSSSNWRTLFGYMLDSERRGAIDGHAGDFQSRDKEGYYSY
jgi:hypothetical protein